MLKRWYLQTDTLTSRQRPRSFHVVSLLRQALEAFYQELRRWGELDGSVESDRVWMTCSCGAVLVHVAPFS